MKEKQCGCIRRQAVTKADTDTDSNIDMDVDDEGPSKSSSDKTNQAVQIAPSKPKSRTTTRPRSTAKRFTTTPTSEQNVAPKMWSSCPRAGSH
jgi:hypothetical protein